MQAMYMACDASNLQPASASSSGAVVQQCSAPVWVSQPGLLPSLDAASGITIGVAILVCWATAHGFRSLRQTGE